MNSMMFLYVKVNTLCNNAENKNKMRFTQLEI